MKTKVQLRQEIRNVRTAANDATMRERLQSVLNGIVDCLGLGAGSVSEYDFKKLVATVAELEARVAALEPKEDTTRTEDEPQAQTEI